MEKLCRLILLMILISGLSACGIFSSDGAVVRVPLSLKNLTAETVQLTEVWSRKIGKGVGVSHEHLVPAVRGDIIYAAGADGTVVALDRQKGSVIWKRKLKDIRVGSGVSVGNDVVLLGTLGGEVIALNKEDGSDTWKARISSEVLSIPITGGGVAIVKGIDDSLTALDSHTGKFLWSQNALQPALILRGSSAPVIDNNAVFVGYASGDVKAFLLKGGEQIWSSKISMSKGSTELERMVDIDSTPMIVGDVLFAVSYQGNVVALERYTGRALWSKEISSYKAMSEGFGSIYLSNQDSFVSALDQRNGASSWRQEALQYRQLTGPATFNSYIVVGDYQGYIHLLSQVDGSLSGRFKAGGAALKAQPQVVDDMIYVLSSSGTLMALKKR
ncbi:MAG: outer membrane protein assembly factor BamB [Candidatus Endonucleobacter sp. (ex Gigantidas childressi)]|nr:outer membrane protein assembly factor BamB [Candidatus Endonucleobacter sp. (ex Gigantidas childressi)]